MEWTKSEVGHANSFPDCSRAVKSVFLRHLAWKSDFFDHHESTAVCLVLIQPRLERQRWSCTILHITACLTSRSSKQNGVGVGVSRCLLVSRPKRHNMVIFSSESGWRTGGLSHTSQNSRISFHILHSALQHGHPQH